MRQRGKKRIMVCIKAKYSKISVIMMSAAVAPPIKITGKQDRKLTSVSVGKTHLEQMTRNMTKTNIRA